MVIKDYRSLFPSRIWHRGMGYYRDGRVFCTGAGEDILYFEAKGELDNYRLTLKRSTVTRQGVQFSCTCPYRGPCKHMAAAIMVSLDEGLLIREEDQLPKPEDILKEFHEQTTLINLESSSKKSRVIPFPHSVDSTPGEMNHRLFFLIQWELNSFYSNRDSGFYLFPYSEYIKKDGSPGRTKALSRFSDNLLSSPEEVELHRLIHYLPDGENTLLTLLPDLDDLPEADVRISTDQGMLPLTLRTLESLHIFWSVDYRNEAVQFRPMCRFNHSDLYLGEMVHFDKDFRVGLFQIRQEPVLYRLTTRASDFPLLDEIFGDQSWFSKDEVLELMERHHPPYLTMERQQGQISLKKILPRPRFMLRETFSELEIQVYFLYGQSEVSAGSMDQTVQDLSPGDNAPVFYQRDREVERALVLQVLGLSDGPNPLPDPFGLELSLETFIVECSERIYQRGGDIFLKDDKKKIETAPLQFRINSGIDWLETRLSLKGEALVIPAYIPRSGLIPYSGGYKLLNPQEREKLTALLARGKRNKGKIRSSNRDFSTLALLEKEIVEQDDSGLQRWLEVLRELRKGYKGFSLAAPKGLEAKLRPYQKKGLRWLRFLHRYRLGGILADDMGLGKTLQAIALMQHADEAEKPFLVSAPVSTLNNWQREIERFAPSLKTHLHQGADRTPWVPESGQVVLTSYHTLMRDEELFLKQPWDIVFLDESQALKNSGSRSYKTVKVLDCEQYIALSGTPVENHIGELWSLMNLLNPGLLGDLKGFLSRYRKPLQDGNQTMMEELKSRIRPFILRRKKEEVATDLPEREEIVLTLPLSPKERIFYDRQKKAYIDEIKKLKQKKAKPFELSSALLQALNSLRQCAISPLLRNGPDLSSKLDLAMEKIEEAREENHKLLVFSQYTRVLELMEPRLEKKNIPWLRLDGSMTAKKREKGVKAFQDDPEMGVFLISIKAGGTGINLVEADYVIILDPWWNPAVESQAIDRTHRIGQTKKVTAYKFIAEDTVEEKVLALQQQKTDLVEGLLAGSSSPLKKMDSEEIMGLF